MQKVYDRVSRKKLFEVRRGYGVQGILVDMIERIYDVRALGVQVAQCRQGFKYLMVNKDGGIEEKGQAGFLYADDVCLMASNEQDMQLLIVLVDVLKSIA